MRAVDVYTVQPWGLYMARPTPGRAQFHYLESWLLPSLGLRASIYHFNPGHQRDQDFYLDIGEFTSGETVWHAEDHYLDLVLRTGIGTELVDLDELLAAVHEGVVPMQLAERALRRALHAVDGLARHDHDLHRWLSAGGLELTWRGAYSLPP